MNEQHFALLLESGEYRIGTLDLWKTRLDWIVFEVLWDQGSFKQVVNKDGKWCFV